MEKQPPRLSRSSLPLCSQARYLAALTYTLKSNTRNRIPGTNLTEIAVSCVGFRGVPIRPALFAYARALPVLYLPMLVLYLPLPYYHIHLFPCSIILCPCYAPPGTEFRVPTHSMR
eukprot:996185-Rhodomonas_salina.1